MTNTKSTKRALLVSVMAMAICFTMLLGTTFAWFTDSEASTGNKITAGTLEVGFDYKTAGAADYTTADSVTMFNHVNWEPGYLEYRNIKVTNEGSLAFNYKLRLVANGPLHTSALGATLANVIDVYYIAGAKTITRAADGTTDLTGYTKAGTLAEVLAMDNFVSDYIDNKNEADEYTLVLVMQTTAGNEYQGLDLGATFNVQVLAAQRTTEIDDVNNNYDNGATYEDGTSSNP